MAALKSAGYDPEVIEYLQTPLSATKLKALQQMLGIPLRDMLRKKEPIYKELNLNDPALTEKQLLNLMTKHPVLLERPIVVMNSKAMIARPLDLNQLK